MLKRLIKFLKLLNGDVSPGQIAAGLAFGMFFAFTPLFSLHNVFVLLLVCIFRVNVTAVIVGLALFSPIAWLLDPYFIQLGEAMLTRAEWQGFWTALYQQDIWRLMHFNNTMTLGSVVISTLLWLPAFFVFRLLIIKYRSRFLVFVNKLGIVKWLKASKKYQMIAGMVSKVEGRS